MIHRFFVEAKKRLNMLVQEIINRCHDLVDNVDTIQNPTLRAFVQSTATRTADACQLFTQFPRMDAIRAEGSLGHVIYVGENDTFKVLLLETLFPDGYSETDLGRVSLLKLADLTQNWLQENDLVVCRVSNFFPWRIPATYAFSNPMWIEQVLRLSKTADELLEGSHMRYLRREVRRVQKHNIQVRFSHSPEDLELFYHRMYVPTAQQRHQKRAIIMPYHYYEDLFRVGFILFLSLDGQDIAANFCKIKDGTFYFSSMGLMDGNQEWLKYEVNVALYWYGIQHAFEVGVQNANLGTSRAWVHDGVFQFKSQWYPGIHPVHYHRDQLLVRANNLSPEWQERLNQIGFITCDGNQYLRVFIDCARPSMDEARAQAAKNGLDGIQIITPGQHENYDALVLQNVAE
jgi:Acetyltransferase (GNAT) domain